MGSPFSKRIATLHWLLFDPAAAGAIGVSLSLMILPWRLLDLAQQAESQAVRRPEWVPIVQRYHPT